MISGPDLYRALFAPRGVALVGASSDPAKTSARPLRYMRKHGYSGAIYPVNPGAEEISGLPCFADLKSLPGPADQAFITLPGEAASAALRDCAEAGIGCATILAGGFAEAGEAGRQRQDTLLEVARSAGVRLLGPNSIGVINSATGLALSANAMLELPELKVGRTAVISQSGSLIGALLSHAEARDEGYSKLISVGNEADITLGEIGELLLDDEATEVIVLFLETLRQRRRVAAFARRAQQAGKPVIAYQLGRSVQGQELARSHTGAIIGSARTLAAFLDHHGIARVNVFEALIEAPALFSGRRARAADQRQPSPRTAVVTTTGGGGAMVVDNLGLSGIDVAPAPAQVVERLAAEGIAQDGGRLIDLTMAGARPEIVAGVIGDLMADEDIDAVAMVVGSTARFSPQLVIDPLLEWRQAPKPFAIYLAPDAEASRRRLAQAGMAVFRTPESCADALQALLTWPAPAVEAEPPSSLPPPLPGPSDRSLLDETEALAVFAGLGIAVAAGEIAESCEAALAAARRLGYPVVLKIASPQIAHKTECGGVAVGIADDSALVEAYERILKNARAAEPQAEIAGVLVQKMHQGRAEVLLGLKHDGVVGPTLVLGLGGILAELTQDTSLRLAPVSADQARAMIEEVAGLAPLRGYRNLPPGDVVALARAIAAFSQLAWHEEVREAEINPLLVGHEGAGVVAVDGLIVRQTN
ncbi:MAG TPA: acetate--CoA ligase family protein [Alphaproteobacteria bacterium]|jgi:acyl-CoA synthetase (NDP forming)|nr:acetate--CoA ligase family protein [Alphaproteobacteria bacterium]MDP7164892.1 acetate--CoA ligase family protein [Alphaproteobacteria bacterium]MDP7428535.1 acetate--CoA ligase family protein [Alphaproteobacteria bacterium]HJM49820.1 acetate--CoA ligase family protein [Alphaproteobacteria bacterium]